MENSRRLWMTVGLLAWSGISPLLADDRSLLRLIDPDVAVCVLVERPEAMWQSIEQGPALKVLGRSAAWQQLLKGDVGRGWDQLDSAAKYYSGVGARDHWLNLTGRGLVLAAHVRGEREPMGVLVSRGRSAEAVQATLKFWREIDPGTEHLSRTHREQAYKALVNSSGKTEAYYAAVGDVFAIAGNETLLQHVLDHLASRQTPKTAQAPVSLLDVPEYQQVAAHVPPDQQAYVFVAPRRWDDALKIKGPTKDAGEVMLKQLWQNCNGIGLSVDLAEAWSMHGWWSDAQVTAPAPAQHTTAARLPNETVATLLLSIDPRPLIAMVEKALPQHEQAGYQEAIRVLKSLASGLDPRTDVGPALSRDMTAAICWRSPADGVEELGALVRSQLSQNDDNATSTMQAAVNNLATFGMNLIVAFRQSKEPGLSGWIDFQPHGMVIRGWPRWEPCLAWDGMILTAATHESLLRAGTSPDTTASDWLKREAPQAAIAMVFDMTRWRQRSLAWGQRKTRDGKRDAKWVAASQRIDEAFTPFGTVGLAGTPATEGWSWRLEGTYRGD